MTAKLWMHSFKTYLPAWIPSHVDDSLMSTRPLSIPASLYIAMKFNALATIPSLSKDNLLTRISISALQLCYEI